MIAAGTHTSAPPMPGMIESTVITVPQKIAPSMPTIQNAKPPRMPCASPISTVPLSVARVTDTNCSSMRSLSIFGHRQIRHDRLHEPRPAGEEEEHRVEHHDEVEEEHHRGASSSPRAR